jgi:hypothetical protein
MSQPADIPRVLLDRAVEDELVARSLLPIEGVTDAGVGSTFSKPLRSR